MRSVAGDIDSPVDNEAIDIVIKIQRIERLDHD
jgi:hypothetical protein